MVSKIVRVTVSQTIAGTILAQNVFHYATSETGPEPATSTLGGFLYTSWIQVGGDPAKWTHSVTPTIHFDNMKFDVMYSAANIYDGYEAGLGGIPGLVGAGGAWLTPPCCVAGIITWKTALSGRGSRGRSYIAGTWYEGGSGNTAAVISPGATERAALVALADYIINPRIAGVSIGHDWHLILVRPTITGKTAPINPIALGVPPITGYSIPNYWGTMGSRRGGRGR